jgi:septum formation protein
MLILASSSATRKALLAGAGLKFESCPAGIDERKLQVEAESSQLEPQMLATRLAAAKALSVAAARPGSTVIGADQVLAFDGELLHKPADMDAARAQLRHLRGATHHLHAGVALARGGELLWSHVASASLTLRRFTDGELDVVLAEEGPEVLASVGAYRLEGPSIRLFERIDGDYFTILGLPLLPLLAALRAVAPATIEGFT